MGTLMFLVDADNTLLDNDRVKADLAACVVGLVGETLADVFWDAYEAVRTEREVVDYPRTLERFQSASVDHRAYARIAEAVLDYPYEKVVYPGALAALAHLRTLGGVVIVSDGDAVYQPAKIARAGLLAVVDDLVITVHKERDLAAIAARHPADRHVLIDDKPQILVKAKAALGGRITAVHVQQGH